MKLSEAIKILKDAGVDNPRHDARILFMHFCGMDFSELISSDVFSDKKELIDAIERRKNREPLQYITGTVGFYREEYNVNNSCLIPREDTEILVNYAVKNMPEGKRFLDLCTGSGCIAISTLANTHNTRATAVDISKAALCTAKTNAEKNGVADRIQFIEADVLSYEENDGYFAILSNPPYVTEEEYEALAPEIFFEPKIALTAKDQGLEFYKKIISNYKDSLDEEGFFAFEIGSLQADALISISHGHGLSCEIIKDCSQKDRVAIIRRR
ncbi:MAG: peptide chain release factor N(5)-glutamine methyltransferase [Ruminococcaceae bacterium]|nr:peptide chain release factor N(5)-glutamine methyltransferase [Oscillospiraceae bacterium]